MLELKECFSSSSLALMMLPWLLFQFLRVQMQFVCIVPLKRCYFVCFCMLFTFSSGWQNQEALKKYFLKVLCKYFLNLRCCKWGLYKFLMHLLKCSHTIDVVWMKIICIKKEKRFTLRKLNKNILWKMCKKEFNASISTIQTVQSYFSWFNFIWKLL